MTLLDGGLLVAYVLAAAPCLRARRQPDAGARRALPRPLAHRSLPPSGAGADPACRGRRLPGLSSLTVAQLRSDGILLPFVGEARAALLVLASLWSGRLAWRIIGLHAEGSGRRVAALCAFCAAMAPADAAWLLLFRVW